MFKDHKLLCDDSPTNICETLVGKVFETADIMSVKEPYLSLTERQEDGRTITRFACDVGLTDTAQSVAPNLEDVFLYVYRDEVV
jgi:hypothetical protein